MDSEKISVVPWSNTDPMTLTRHLIKSQKTHKEATGDFTLLLSSIQTACKFIDHKVRKAGIANLYGLAGNENSTGDSQKKLDVLSNEVFIKMLQSNQQCALLASEEEESAYIIDLPDAKYVVAFDPLE